MFQQIFHVKFSINWLRWIIYSAFLMVILYLAFPKWHDPLVFIAAILGGIGVLISAMNDIDARREEISQGRAREALRFISDWNSPEFYHAKNKGREVLAHFEQNGHGTHPFVEERLQNLMDVLNFFEEMSIAIQLDHVDDAVARRFFRSITINYWQMTEPWIKNRRAGKQNTRLLIEFEELAKRWS
jgi:Domain of unknown function (DUF4760)